MSAAERELLRLLLADPVFRGLCARAGLAVATGGVLIGAVVVLMGGVQ